MMLRRWFPWKQIISSLARSRGFIDPVSLLSRLEGFGQPLEVREPMELLRAGLVFHARGLLNTGAIQHNLDWVWPYWVERQYNPHDEAFIPRAFSITHVNLTCRNWTAVGIPGIDELPIVDPRGLVTPFWDSWSIDAWIVTDQGENVYPSRLSAVNQYLDMVGPVTVVTVANQKSLQLISRVTAQLQKDGSPACVIDLSVSGPDSSWLVVALRPYNPEGVSFVNDISLLPENNGWLVDKKRQVRFSRNPDQTSFSYYRQGDVKNSLFTAPGLQDIQCRVGMATAAALFRVSGGNLTVKATIPLASENKQPPAESTGGWPVVLAEAAKLEVPEPLFQYLYDAALRSLVLHSPAEIYPGPFTYKRFWFRDAVFALHAMLAAGLLSRVELLLDSFPGRQSVTGFFHSQEGEWDSNGEVLWMFQQYCKLSGKPPRTEWSKAISRGAEWIIRKRLPADTGTPFSGLLPAGFSAEHLGPNDYYYWDDFWGVAGLRAAADWFERVGVATYVERYREVADQFFDCVQESLVGVAQRLNQEGMPASPFRRMDPGAIGSLVAGYPLQLFAANDQRLLSTVDFLMEKCTFKGGFFQDVIHSGINSYLTLHMAQILLRARDTRGLALFRTVAELASPTGQWPEAIHPRTLGGCMGDGHHVWASAEWVVMQRNCFVREEGESLVLAGGLFREWLTQPKPLSFGPTPTPFGKVTVRVTPKDDSVTVAWQGEWHSAPPKICVCLPHFPVVTPEAGASAVTINRSDKI
ncbi:MAG: hypothetical protein ACI8PB_004611 [Desulforhopalus sp.]|jgi:hypothetical protein